MEQTTMQRLTEAVEIHDELKEVANKLQRYKDLLLTMERTMQVKFMCELHTRESWWIEIDKETIKNVAKNKIQELEKELAAVDHRAREFLGVSDAT